MPIGVVGGVGDRHGLIGRFGLDQPKFGRRQSRKPAITLSSPAADAVGEEGERAGRRAVERRLQRVDRLARGRAQAGCGAAAASRLRAVAAEPGTALCWRRR